MSHTGRAPLVLTRPDRAPLRPRWPSSSLAPPPTAPAAARPINVMCIEIDGTGVSARPAEIAGTPAPRHPSTPAPRSPGQPQQPRQTVRPNRPHPRGQARLHPSHATSTATPCATWTLLSCNTVASSLPLPSPAVGWCSVTKPGQHLPRRGIPAREVRPFGQMERRICMPRQVAVQESLPL